MFSNNFDHVDFGYLDVMSHQQWVNSIHISWQNCQTNFCPNFKFIAIFHHTVLPSCGFCHCLYKYQVRLNHHVITKHMVELKHLSDSERRSLIILYLEDDRDITYCQFQNEYFNQKKYLSLYIDNWHNKIKLCLLIRVEQ